MAEPRDDPSTPSLAHAELCDYWKMIRAILGGADEIKECGTDYLPQYPAEDGDEYARRKESAPWRPEFEDAVRAISAKPFAKAVQLAGEPSEAMKELSYDIDGRGNNLHTFARDLFEDGVSLGAAGILVDFPAMAAGATLADERQVGARPYWVAIAADEILALRTVRVGAKEVVTHLRVKETAVVIDGFAETEVERIRVIEPGLWQVWGKNDDEWVLETEGTLSLAEVPFVFFATADRRGPQYVRPPLLDLAEMQIELYRQLSNKEQIFTIAGSPMLTANGMGAPENGAAVQTGPGRVLYAPGAEGIQTSWDYIQPDAANLTEIREDIVATIEDMRRLGLQPMLPKSGTFTATGQSIEAAKAHTAVQSWALDLKDALEQAFKFTAQWMGSTEIVEVNVNTDFAVGMYGDVEVKVLFDSRSSNFISEETYWDELARRGVLGPQFDKDVERERLIEEMPGDANEADGLDANGNPLPPLKVAA